MPRDPNKAVLDHLCHQVWGTSNSGGDLQHYQFSNIISLINIINIITRWSSNSNIISLISILNRVKNLYQSTYRVQCAIASTFSITTINIIIIMITITITTNIISITTININMSLKQGVLQLAEFSVHHPKDSGSEASLQGLSFKIDRHYPHQH